MGKPSRIYDLLVQGNEDVVGALAYALYKQHKIAYLRDFHAENGRPATDTDLVEFNRLAHLPQTLNGYKEQAERLVLDFLDNALAEKLEAAAADTVDSVIVEQVKQAKEVVQADLQVINARLSESKGAKGWAKDIVTNLIVSIVTVTVVGLAAVGLGAVDALSSATKAYITTAAKVAK